jgi:large subunit ribosomal protein L21
MYAIIVDGARQYKVEPGKELLVDRKPLKEGERIEFSEVLLFNDGNTTRFGNPFVKDIKVIGEVLEHLKGKKIRVFKYKRRKGYRKTIGHRQRYTRVRILQIQSATEGV